MVYKCSVKNCNLNYEKIVNGKRTYPGGIIKVFKPPKENSELWINALPNSFPREINRNNVWICRKHWPDDVEMVSTTGGKMRPAVAPSIFHGIPSSCFQQTAPTTSRRISDRKISIEDRNEQLDELTFFNERDVIKTFEQLVSYYKNSFEEKGHLYKVIISDDSLCLLKIKMLDNIPLIHYSLSITRSGVDILGDRLIAKCSVDNNLVIANSLVSLGKQNRIFRHSQISEIITRLENFELDALDLSDSKRPKKYSIIQVYDAFKLFCISRKAYEEVRKSLNLPSKSTLLSYRRRFKDSLPDNILKLINAQTCKLAIIHIDEVALKPSYQIYGREILGKAYDDENTFAKSMVAVMVTFLKGGDSFVIKTIPFNKFDGRYFSEIVLNSIDLLQRHYCQVVTVISDNHKTNQNGFSRLPEFHGYYFMNPDFVDQPIFIMIDPVHLGKSIRNNIITEKTQTLEIKDDISAISIKWSDIIQLYKDDCDKILRVYPSLTSKCLFPNNIEKQNVSKFLAVFNEKVVAGLRLKGFNSSADFIELIVLWWDIINSSSFRHSLEKLNSYKRPITSNDRWQLYFIHMFSEIITKTTYVTNIRQKCLTKDTAEGLMNTCKSLIAVCDYLFDYHGFDFICLKDFQNDCLEGEFGVWRQSCGGGYLLTAANIHSALVSRTLGLSLKHELLEPYENPTAKFGDGKCHSLNDNDCVLKFLDSNFESSFQEQEAIALVYVSGYLCKSIPELPGSNKGDNDFIELLSRGGLVYPSKEVVNIVAMLYSIYSNAFKSDTLSFTSSCKNCTMYIFLTAVKHLNLFRNLDDIVSAKIVNKILLTLINIFFKGATNFLNVPCTNKQESSFKVAKFK